MGNRSTISRKAIKRTARSALKRHYLMLVLLCLISSTIGLEYAGTVGSLSMGSGESSDQLVESGSTSVQGFSGVWHMLSEGDETVGARTASLFISEKQEEPEIKIGNISLGRTRGVFASALNMVTSGAVLVRVYAAIFNVVGSDSVASSIFVVLSLCLYLAFQVCVINVFYVIFRRMVLETRIYAKVPVQRSMFLLRCRKWLHVGRALLIAVLMELAWWLTIVGGVIKHYAYCLTPYILAENPALTGRQAVTISRTLMRGHKWERFKLDLSFWWYYGLMALAACVSYGDAILPMLGVTLPFNDTVGFYLFFFLYLAMLFAIYYFLRNGVEIAYAKAYDSLWDKPADDGVVLGNIFDM